MSRVAPSRYETGSRASGPNGSFDSPSSVARAPSDSAGPLDLGSLVGRRLLLGGDLLFRLVDGQVLELRVHERHLRGLRLELPRGADPTDELLPC